MLINFVFLIDSQVISGGARHVKSRKRTQSRGSTASIHSITTQPNLEQAGFADATDMYQAQWIPNEQLQHKDIAPAPQMSPEDLILQAASHMQASSREFSMDASMGGTAMSHPISYQQHHTISRHPLPGESYVGNSFTEDSQMLDRDEHEDGDSIVGGAGMQKPASSRSSANNELEMRQLFTANKHRNLQDVATELHGNERGPNSERTRQVFAMLW
jgi:regulatory factor X, other